MGSSVALDKFSADVAQPRTDGNLPLALDSLPLFFMHEYPGDGFTDVEDISLRLPFAALRQNTITPGRTVSRTVKLGLGLHRL